jgi:hypothetical protein
VLNNTLNINPFPTEFDSLRLHDKADPEATAKKRFASGFKFKMVPKGESWGGEFTGTYQLLERWRVRMGYTYFDRDVRSKPRHTFDLSYLDNDTRNHALLRSMLNLPGGLQLDLIARYMDLSSEDAGNP